MADPLSITASIIAALQITQTVLQYCNDAKGAEHDRAKLAKELSCTQEVLYLLLQTAAINAKDALSSRSLLLVQKADGPLDQYRECLASLKGKLTPAT